MKERKPFIGLFKKNDINGVYTDNKVLKSSISIWVNPVRFPQYDETRAIDVVHRFGGLFTIARSISFIYIKCNG